MYRLLSAPYWNFLNNETSQFASPGPRIVFIPESFPTLPFAADAKQLVSMYASIDRSPCALFGSHVSTTRGAKSSLPVMRRFLSAFPIPVNVYDAVCGAPTLKLDSPEICQPLNTWRNTGRSRNVFGRARLGIS